MFNKFKEKLGSFKKALSKTIDRKAVASNLYEPVPEAEEILEDEIEPILDETDFETSLEEESPEIKPVESVKTDAYDCRDRRQEKGRIQEKS